MRATGDNPLVDSHEARRVMACILNNEVDYVTGFEIVDGMGLPVGVGVEAFTFGALERSWLEATEKKQREHVNEYVLDEPNSFVIFRLKCLEENDCPGLRLTVDTSPDLAFVEQILADIGKGRAPWEISTRQIIEWWKKRRNRLS
jgi:spore coat polysaccharide biosynthesis protein SpsF (cytidylyltransferase family)